MRGGPSKYVARFVSLIATAVWTVWMLLPHHGVDGHAFQTRPVSRQYLRTSKFNNGEVYPIEKHADAYNGGGPIVVKARQLERTDEAVLERYGGGEIWPPAAAWDMGERAENGNYLEDDDIAVSHGVCGDTPQSGDNNKIIYSTPNEEWHVLETYDSGSIIDIDVIFTNYHWGHIEFFLCCTSDMKNPSGVVTQSCFNKYPLDRAEDDSFNSPVDPNYPGRYYIDPPCRKDETDQTRPKLEGVLNDGHVTHMRYKLPDISCDHAVLQMAYHSGKGCKSPGYDEFNPKSWPSKCAPNKEDWIETSSAECRKPGAKYGNVFWQCSDIALRKSKPEPRETPVTPTPTKPPADPITHEPTPAPSTPVLPTPAPKTPAPETPAPTDALVDPSMPERTTAPSSPVVPTPPPTPAPVDDTLPRTPTPHMPVRSTPDPDTPAPTTSPAEDCPTPDTSSPTAPPDTRAVPTPEVTSAPLPTVSSAPVTDVTSAPLPTVSSAPVTDVTPVPTYGGPMASPSPAGDCLTAVEPYEQCGGTGWPGPSCCLEGYECVALEVCYSQCRPAVCANEWEQCGGSNSCEVWSGPTCCVPGSQCVAKSKGWSHCQPNKHRSCGV